MRISDWSSDVCSSDLQDFPFVGLTSQISATWNINREKGDIQIDHNGFPVRPALLGDLRGRDYDAVYLGYSADGRIGRINLTASLYAALGEDRSEEHTSELQSLLRISYAVFCLKKKNKQITE